MIKFLFLSAITVIPVGAYDGDTITVTIPEWPPIVGEAMPIRVRGVDTPEIRGKCQSEKALAREARLFTRKAIASAHVLELSELERGKYFRLVADVIVDGVSLSELLINNKLGRRYDGGARAGWCGR